MRVEKLRDNFDVEIRLVHFPLHPETPAEGSSLEALYASRGMDPEAMYRRMKSLMDAEGLPYEKRSHTYNSRFAQELGKWADTVPGGEALHMPLYQAYFVERRNIGDPAVLLDIVEKAGLPVGEARTVIEQRTFKEAVDADWELSRRYGVTGVPTYVAKRQGVVGAQPYEVLEQLMEAVGAKRRS